CMGPRPFGWHCAGTRGAVRFGEGANRTAWRRAPAWERHASTVVRRGTVRYAHDMTLPSRKPTDVSVRQFVADSGSVTRGLRQGRAYVLTLNGEPLAKMIPIRRRQAVSKEEVFAIFAAAPVIDVDELRSELDAAVTQDMRDPYEGTGL
ncbi:MAG: hypothetical protein ACREOE_13575, partial [Gemmatimonadales bacterium]